MKLILAITLLALSLCISTTYGLPAQVQIEQQPIVKIPSNENQESSTKSSTGEILERIKEINNNLNKSTNKAIEANGLAEAHHLSNQKNYSKTDVPSDDPSNKYSTLSGRSYPYPPLQYIGPNLEKIDQVVDSGNGNFENIDNEMLEDFKNANQGQGVRRKVFHREQYLVPNPVLNDPRSNYMNFYQNPQYLQNNNFPNSMPVTQTGLPGNRNLPYQLSSENDVHNYQHPLENYENNGQMPRQFQWQWPLANYFPILIKDPFLSIYNGWSGVVEYGPDADICSKTGKVEKDKPTSRQAKSLTNVEIKPSVQTAADKKEPSLRSKPLRNNSKLPVIASGVEVNDNTNLKSSDVKETRGSNVNDHELETNGEKFKDEFQSDEAEDVRMPFGGFGLFGNKRPVVPSPGFFINKLRVRKGGVAIAGPGGIATAGSGGTAIVGPGGLAYTQKGGLAIAGPSARIIALPPDVDLNQLISNIEEQKKKGAGKHTEARSLNAQLMSDNEILLPPGSKVVATGPIVYYNIE